MVHGLRILNLRGLPQTVDERPSGLLQLSIDQHVCRGFPGMFLAVLVAHPLEFFRTLLDEPRNLLFGDVNGLGYKANLLI